MDNQGIAGAETRRLVLSKYRELLDLSHTAEDRRRLKDAYRLVLEIHRDSWEATGREYVYHSIEVARIATREIGLGTTSVICALLHNAVDGSRITLSEVRRRFGSEVADIVEGFTRLSDLQTEKMTLHSENFRKLYLSLVKDIRSILVKLAHRLYDMRNWDSIPERNRQKFLDEVFHLYAPIAHRLGLYRIKTEIEDLWLRHAHADVYESIASRMQRSAAKQKVYIQEFIRPIERRLMKEGVVFDIKGRPKSIHSVWRKMTRQRVSFDEVYDLFAIRIIIRSEPATEKAECWRVYSIVTDIYQPNPGRLRDWISTPKASGYESLHTTVIGPEGRWVEVQIRTERMDEIAEKGIASHWKYKESGKTSEQTEWMNRIREALEKPEGELLEKSQDSKLELYSDRIFIFTPEGDLRKLPAGATVLDFAYDIHSSLGDMCSGARVNGKIVPIRHVLKNGDQVEIITGKNQKPKMDWLAFVVTPKAKSKIKRAIREEKFREAEVGKDILRRKLRNRKIPFSDAVVDKLIRQYKLKSSVDLYYLIAIEKIDLSGIRKTLTEEKAQDAGTHSREADEGAGKPASSVLQPEDDVFVLPDSPLEGLNYELAKCCNPISGDAVFGFVTIGKGITIHRLNCPNAAQLLKKYEYRIIDVQWRKTDKLKTYLTTIHVTGRDEIGILNDITDVISHDLRVNMVSVNVDAREGGRFEGRFKVSVHDVKHLAMLLKKIQKVKGVRKASRVDHFD